MPKYIDADIAWKRLEAAYWEDNGDRDMAEDILDAQPAADVAPVVHGRWKKTDICDDDPWRCSRCGNTVSVMGYKICPNCGALMDGEDEDNV